MKDVQQAARRLLNMTVSENVRKAFADEHGRELPTGITNQELLQYLHENGITFLALDRRWEI